MPFHPSYTRRASFCWPCLAYRANFPCKKVNSRQLQNMLWAARHKKKNENDGLVSKRGKNDT
eukprot:scaffold2642_cov120-Cylindrotheca_fusiformis.AAC.14